MTVEPDWGVMEGGGVEDDHALRAAEGSYRLGLGTAKGELLVRRALSPPGCWRPEGS